MSARPFRVALNGYGRIGRCVLRALSERKDKTNFEIIALNDIADQASIEYLTRFDSTHGRFPGEVRVDGDCLHIDGVCVKCSVPKRQRRLIGPPWILICSSNAPGNTPHVPMLSVFLMPVCHVYCSRSRWKAPKMWMPPLSMELITPL